MRAKCAGFLCLAGPSASLGLCLWRRPFQHLGHRSCYCIGPTADFGSWALLTHSYCLGLSDSDDFCRQRWPTWDCYSAMSLTSFALSSCSLFASWCRRWGLLSSHYRFHLISHFTFQRRPGDYYCLKLASFVVGRCRSLWRAKYSYSSTVWVDSERQYRHCSNWYLLASWAEHCHQCCRPTWASCSCSWYLVGRRCLIWAPGFSSCRFAIDLDS